MASEVEDGRGHIQRRNRVSFPASEQRGASFNAIYARYIKKIIFFYMCTKVEVFLGKEVREARADGGAGANTRGGATKKREISCTSLPINLHF